MTCTSSLIPLVPKNPIHKPWHALPPRPPPPPKFTGFIYPLFLSASPKNELKRCSSGHAPVLDAGILIRVIPNWSGSSPGS
jgi:hypothetical protein